MELVSTMEISGEEREIADAYAREQIAMNAQNIAANTEGIAGLNSNLTQQSTEAMDLKMLGWTVPKECPIQNYVDSDGVFHQRVGRLDLGSLKYTVQTAYNRIITAVTVDSIKSVISTKLPNAYTDYCRTETSYNAWNNKGTIDRCLAIESNTPPDISIYSPPSDLSELKGHYLYYELAEEILIKIDGNEAVTKVNESLSIIGKCKNLLNPTLQTTTLNGVTCTANGDGTYTLNGTATGEAYFLLKELKVNSGAYKLLGCPSGGSDNTYKIYDDNLYTIRDIGNGYTITLTESKVMRLYIYIGSGVTCNNLIFKPMITTDLNATYDDFVPYTGDGETLTHDVASLKNDLSATEEKIKSDDIQYEYYTKKSDGSVLASGVAASDSIRDAVSQMNNNMGVLLQAHNGLNEKVHFKDDITTNETLIGTFNGKNYYRKLFTGISGSGGSVTVNVGEKIEIYNYYGRAYVYGQSGASAAKYPIPNKNYYIDSQNASETSFQLTIPTSSDTRKVDLVIEYTKVDE